MKIDASAMQNLQQQMQALQARSSELNLGNIGNASDIAQDIAPLNGVSGVSAPGNDFGQFMKSQLDAVNSQQKAARSLATSFELGDPDVSLVDVMIQSQKSSVSFRAAVEVRNKMLGAYQEIMNMPV